MTHVPQCDPMLIPIVRALLHERVPVDQIGPLVYLMDWKSAIEEGRQITDVSWTVDGSANLSVDAVTREVEVIRVAMRSNRGFVKTMLDIAEDPEIDLPASARASYDHVIRETMPNGRLNIVALAVLVKSTFPCFTANPDSPPFDLPSLAATYAATAARIAAAA